jgi:transposase-like protein
MTRTIKTEKINRRSGVQDNFEDKIDILRSRVGLLEGTDRALMRMYLDNGETFSRMARVAGVNESSVARRIYKITKRLLDGQYITILRNRNLFTKQDLRIARDYFLRGLSMRTVARAHKTTFYQVRNTMKRIQELTKL